MPPSHPQYRIVCVGVTQFTAHAQFEKRIHHVCKKNYRVWVHYDLRKDLYPIQLVISKRLVFEPRGIGKVSEAIWPVRE